MSSSDGATSKEGSSRPQFGGRLLLNEDDVFKHNAWDNVEWGAEQESAALAAVAGNSQVTLSDEDMLKLEEQAATHWDKFYNQHQNKFFKNRNWLFTEFPELAPHLANTFPIKVNIRGDAADLKQASSEDCLATLQEHVPFKEVNTTEEQALAAENVQSKEQNGTQERYSLENKPPSDCCDTKPCKYPGSAASYRVLEIGCGVGNTIFPLLQTNNDPNLFVYGADFSSTAINIIKQHQEYDTKRCNVFVLDVTSSEWDVPFPHNSLDAITCLYVFSAIHPDKHSYVAKKLSACLRPGGVLLFRDYGRYDLAQLRFKKGKCIADNFYVRGDGTRSYFFTQDDVRDMFTETGLQEKQNIVDRRLQVNRGKQITMYRVWVQAKYTKPL